MRDRALILSVLIVASCGLGYELISSALASYLLGDSILQFSSVIGCYLFAMGVGSWLSRYVDDDDVLDRFVDLEMLIGLLGGVSAAVLRTWSLATVPRTTSSKKPWPNSPGARARCCFPPATWPTSVRLPRW